MRIRINILYIIILGALLFAAPFTYGQSGNIAINSSGVSPNGSAVLDLSSNTTGGFLLPSLSTANISALGTVSDALLIYNSTSTCYEQYSSSCSCWQVIFCPCSNAPVAPTAITGNTSPCAEAPGPPEFSSTSPYSVSPINDATSYSWTITDVGGGCPADLWTGFIGNGSRSIGGSPVTQDITWWQNCTYTLSVAAVNACGTSGTFTMAVTVAPGNTPATPTITGPATICTGSTNTYTASSGSATSFTWTVPATVGTIASGTGTATITVTGAASAGSGTISVTATQCGSTSLIAGTEVVTVDAPPSAPTITGPASIAASSTGNTYTATSAGATSFTWTVPATVGSSFTGQGTATITVTAAAGAGSGNITATATGSCGTSASSANKAVTVTACGTITADATAASGDFNNSFTITTTAPNDLVIISCDGVDGAFNGSVSVVPPSGAVPTATKYATITDNSTDYAALAIYYFVAPTAGIYTINVTEPTIWTEYGYANFALALTGFCGVPSSANIQNPSSNYNASTSNCQNGLSANLTEIAGSYAIGCFTDFWCDPAPPSNPVWSNLTSISGTYDNNDAYGFAGKAIPALATPSITATQSPGENYGVLYLIDIH